MAKIKSIEGIFGTEHYIDGKYVGYSVDGLFDSKVHYNESNQRVGFTTEGLFGENHYNNDGDKIGYSMDSCFGKTYYDEDGRYAGYGTEDIIGQSTYLNDDYFNDNMDTF